jgi:hypothetical protein
VDAAYDRVSDPLIKARIEKAGARLAALVNATLR